MRNAQNMAGAIRYVAESTVKKLVTQPAVTDAIEQAFIAHAHQSAVNFPIVRETLGHADAIFGFKSAFNRDSLALGLKAGGLWPGNAANGVPNHQSTTVLFDADTGTVTALIGTTYLTALRTAAASALSIRMLSREDSKTLGIIGAGGQGEPQVLAALRERSITNVLIHDMNGEHAETLAKTLNDAGHRARVTDAKTLCNMSDILITITPARSPVLADEDIRPGTHLCCMGADTIGKQEVPESLVARARIFSDVPEQATLLGELQHAFAKNMIDPSKIVRLGDVLAGLAPGRQNNDEITLFDSTGMALQDLAAGQVALDVAAAANEVEVLNP